MAEFWRDVRFALRLFVRSPAFAITALLLLGAGIGANTLIFSLVDALLLRPLPVRDAKHLVQLVEVHPTGFTTWDLPVALYEQLSAKAATLNSLVCQGNVDVAFEDGAGVERIRVNAVSGNFFPALGIQPYLGRILTEEDDRTGALNAVVSYDFWAKRLGQSASAVGRSIRLNGHVFTVAGVLPKGVNGVNADTAPDVRVPLRSGQLLWQRAGAEKLDPFFVQVQIFGWLGEGVTRERAEAELDPVARRASEEVWLRAFPDRKESFDSRFRLQPADKGFSWLRGQFSRGLMVLMACVGLLLLMACSNLACLLLARSAARSQEIGIRLALGANPFRIVRQLLTESLVLALAGGILGILLTFLCRPLLLAAVPPIRDRAAVMQPMAVHLEIDLRVLGFALLVSVATALLFGLSPALRGTRQELTDSIKGTRTATARLWGRNVLVAAQVAICVLLLMGASLLVTTFDRMHSMNAGFDRDHVVTFTIDPGLKGYRAEQAKLLSQRLLDQARSLPGVVAAGIASRGLMRGTGVKATFGAAGSPIGRNDFLNSSMNTVTPGYFDAMGMGIAAGRDFAWSEDRPRKPNQVVVNQAFARHFFPGQNAIGKLFGGKGPNGLALPDSQIIGVVSDAKYRSLREEIPPTVYSMMSGGFESSFILHLRTAGSPEPVVPPVRAILRSLDPDLPFVEVRTLREEVDTSLWQERLLATIASIFGCFSALLAGIGLYGALDSAVKARTREVGIRIALGADPRRVVQLLSGETMGVVAAGAIAGVAMYYAASPWFRHVLYGVESTDPTALGLALGVVGIVAICATVRPVWRAIRIEPASALRQD